MKTYWNRLQSLAVARAGLCVNIDPHPEILRDWGLPETVDGLETCARTIVAALGDKVAVLKPQSAFFEQHGSAGIAVLERVLKDISECGALSILDVKRGDIGSTMAAYAEAYLTDDAPLAADAITVSPYLGFDSLHPAFERAHETGRGVYVLARTSNPEGGSVQLAKTDAGTVAQEIVDRATRLNEESGQFAVGLVIGATHASIGADVSVFNSSILAPGIGAQGGTLDALPKLFGQAAGRVLPAVGRDLICVGPDPSRLVERLGLWTGGLWS